MEEDDYDFAESSQQSIDETGKKKKKKNKKHRRNLNEDFDHAQTMFPGEEEEDEEYSQVLTQEDPETTSPSKKKKKKKKHESQSPLQQQTKDEEDFVEEIIKNESEKTRSSKRKGSGTTPVASSSMTASNNVKKDPVTPKKEAALPNVKADLPPVNLRNGIKIIAAMSNDDLELLLNNVEAECPQGDSKKLSIREAMINWNKVAFSCYGPEQCRTAWAFLMNQTRKYRVMHELVQEVKYNLRTDYQKFMRKSIEAAPDFPKPPYAGGGFQFFCKEKYDAHKQIQEKMNKKAENFLHFQTKCQETWKKLSPAKQKHYDQQAKLLQAEYKQKVNEYYQNYPEFLPKEKLNKNGVPEAKPMSDFYRRKAAKWSAAMYQDAPKPPLTPMQLYIQHKIKRVQPTPKPSEEPELKVHYIDLWKELGKDKKQKWIEKCIKYCERYKAELLEYKKSHPLFLLPKSFQITKLISKEEFGIWAEKHGQPPVPKNKVYDVFAQEFHRSAEAKDIPPDEVHKACVDKWTKLSHLDKEHYKLKFKMEHLNYKKEIEEYINTVPESLRAIVIDNLPKKYQKQFFEDVDKQPLVNADDLLDIDESTSSNQAGSSSQKRKATGENDTSAALKKTKTGNVAEVDAIPLYAEDLNDEHRKLLEQEMQGAQSTKKDVQQASAYFPGKDVTPQILSEAIRGIFDGRQFERRFTVYYYYAKYVAREKSWLDLYKTIGVVETAARIVETFNRLSKHQQQVFLDEAYRFHCTLRFYEKQISSEEDLFTPRLRYFPEEPKPPPRKAAILYQRETQLQKLKDSNYEAPAWEDLDDSKQMQYFKKLYRLTREYILEYERFVRNMTPNDMIEYLIRRATEWDAFEVRRELSKSDQAIYSTAEAVSARHSAETYSLEMSAEGHDPEPEVFFEEIYGGLRKKLDTHKFRYKCNPFSVQTKGGGPHTKNALVERLCNGISKKGQDCPSSTSDEDEEEYGHLVRSDAEKKKDLEFRRKLRSIQRYQYYPLEHYYDAGEVALNVNTGKCKKFWETKEGQRDALNQISDQQKRWARIRDLIGTKMPGKAGAKLPVKKTRKKRKTAQPVSGSPAVIQAAMQLLQINTQLTGSGMKARERPSLSGGVNVRRSDGQSTDSESEPEEIGGNSTTRFIRKAIARTDKEVDEFEELEREKTPEHSPVSPLRRKPALMLVGNSPMRTRSSSHARSNQLEATFLQPLPTPLEPPAIPSKSFEGTPGITSGNEGFISTTHNMLPVQQPEDSSDEFRLLDALGDVEEGIGVFSESELNQFGDLMM